MNQSLKNNSSDLSNTLNVEADVLNTVNSELDSDINFDNKILIKNNTNNNIIEDDTTSCGSSHGSVKRFYSSIFNNFYENIRSPEQSDFLAGGNTANASSIHVHIPSKNVLGHEIFDIKELKTIPNFINYRIKSGFEKESFIIVNINNIIQQYHLWKHQLPMIEPFYSIKCNPDIEVINALASVGCNFACGTMGEIELIINKLGIKSSKYKNITKSIIFSNPTKMEKHINYAINNNIYLTVFDCEEELYKISLLSDCKSLQLLLLITIEDTNSIDNSNNNTNNNQFINKFGCSMNEVNDLLIIAQKLELNIVGIKFHINSDCINLNIYEIAFNQTLKVFKMIELLNMKLLTIINIGNDFPIIFSFQQLSLILRNCITKFSINLNENNKLNDNLKHSMNNISIIAEPGRLFVATSTTIATRIYGRKLGKQHYYEHNEDTNELIQSLYIDNGVYGSFNNIIYDNALLIPIKLSTVIDNIINIDNENNEVNVINELKTVFKIEENNETNKETNNETNIETNKEESNETSKAEELVQTTVFGPTCDGLDTLCSLKFHNCEINDWLIWENQGAYTHTASFVFNGYTHIPNRLYVNL